MLQHFMFIWGLSAIIVMIGGDFIPLGNEVFILIYSAAPLIVALVYYLFTKKNLFDL